MIILLLYWLLFIAHMKTQRKAWEVYRLQPRNQY